MITLIASLLVRRFHFVPAVAARIAKWGLIALAVIAAVVAFNLWLDGREKAAVEAAVQADRAAHDAAVQVEATEAAERASEAVEEEQAETTQRVEGAADAAKDSEDPLADAFGWLRGN